MSLLALPTSLHLEILLYLAHTDPTSYFSLLLTSRAFSVLSRSHTLSLSRALLSSHAAPFLREALILHRLESSGRFTLSESQFRDVFFDLRSTDELLNALSPDQLKAHALLVSRLRFLSRWPFSFNQASGECNAHAVEESDVRLSLAGLYAVFLSSAKRVLRGMACSEEVFCDVQELVKRDLIAKGMEEYRFRYLERLGVFYAGFDRIMRGFVKKSKVWQRIFNEHQIEYESQLAQFINVWHRITPVELTFRFCKVHGDDEREVVLEQIMSRLMELEEGKPLLAKLEAGLWF